MKVDVVRPKDLDSAALARWGEIQASDSGLMTPFLTPHWAQLIDSLRDDARVAVLHEGGRIEGFLPVQRASRFTALPLGGPLSDYQGLVAAPDRAFDLHGALKALQVERLDFTHVPANQASYRDALRRSEGSWTADLSGGFDDWHAQRKAAGHDPLRKTFQKRRKAEREVGPLTITPFSRDPALLHTMIGWKRDQFVATRQPDLFDWAWVVETLERTLASTDPAFSGEITSINLDGKPAAVLMTLRSGPRLHTWFTAYDPAHATYSLGNLVFLETMQVAPALGITEVDFGPGQYGQKQWFATGQREIGMGFIGRPGVATLVRSAAYGVRGLIERHASGPLSELPGKAMRRIDYFRGLGARSRAA